MAATPITEAVATKPTPMSSPYIINRVLLSPILIPILKDNVIHIPGVIDTTKKVGIKIARIDKFI